MGELKMLFYLGQFLSNYWGPARLLQSYAVLIAIALFAGYFLAYKLIPKFYNVLPHDRGREFTVSAEAAKLYGIPEGIPVSAGGGDNMMGAIGTGTVSDGFLTMSMVTSGTLYGYSAKPISDPENGLSGFCSSSGGWLPLLCTMNCTVATEFIRGLFNIEIKDEFAHLSEHHKGKKLSKETIEIIQKGIYYSELSDGAFDISKCKLIAYANGGYYALGEKIGKFGYSVQKKK